MKIAVWVPLDMDVLTTLTFGRSDAQVLISGAFYVVFLCVFTQLGPPDEPQLHPCRRISATRQTSALQGACRRRTIITYEIFFFAIILKHKHSQKRKKNSFSYQSGTHLVKNFYPNLGKICEFQI